MRRGCMSLGDVRCDDCHRIIPHSEPYLVIEEEGEELRLCADCSLKKGYAHYKEEKGERILTFFPE
jgi:NAD-dependent SIR2 family protein deacetylase